MFTACEEVYTMKKQIPMNNSKYEAFVKGKKIDNFFISIPDWLDNLDQIDRDNIRSLKVLSTIYACSGCNVLDEFTVYVNHEGDFCIDDDEWFYSVSDYVLCFWQNEIELRK